MTRNISTIADTSTNHYGERAILSAIVDIAAMEPTDWRTRLRAAVAQSERSMREISLGASLSPGYLHSILEEGKEPTIGRLMKIADELNVSLFKILYGIEIKSDAEELLRLYADLTDEQKSAFLALAKTTARTPKQE